MSDKSLKIATLNLWRYNDWKDRLPRIVALLQEVDPDVILLQEVDLDIAKDPLDQASILSKMLGYGYTAFEKAETLTKWKGQELSTPIDYGLAIIAKTPFTSKVHRLLQASDDRHPRIVMSADFDTELGTVTIANLHFSNRDDWSEAHLKEVLDVLVDSDSILVGDFNIKKISDYKSLYTDKYTSSGDIYDYVSYPDDNLSYDYILLPKKYAFKSFECRQESVSDHRMLVSEITLRDIV